MINKFFKNKDLLVFWTAMTIAACDLLSSGFFAIQEVTAASSDFGSKAVSREERPWPLDLQPGGALQNPVDGMRLVTQADTGRILPK